MEGLMVLLGVVVGFAMGRGMKLPTIGSRPRVIKPSGEYEDENPPTPRVVARSDSQEAQMEENRNGEEFYGKPERKRTRR